MAKPKKKLLPKDFDALLTIGNLTALKAVFEACELDARGGYSKQTALAYNACPDDLARWLVEQGADISAEDSYGETPLHARSGHWQGKIDILLELGADVNVGEGGNGTPLHRAAGVGNLKNAKILLAHGARVYALNKQMQTPLAYALSRCSNSGIEQMAPMAELLLNAEAKRPAPSKGFFGRLKGSFTKGLAASYTDEKLKQMVTRIGEDFEFHRSNFNPDFLDATSAALEKLYTLFDVTPVPSRAMHDGKTSIITKAKRWQDKNEELWELLVPSSGAAQSVQGEVIRIPGKIRGELDGNGGANWDTEYKKMADAFLVLVAKGNALPDNELTEAAAIIKEVKAKRGDTVRLSELAVKWVELNPKPIKLPPPDYDR